MMELILQRLAELRQLDAKRSVFGARSHQYRFGPVLSENEVAQLEARLQIALPEDYRAFVTEVGNGGAGPSYGVIPFEGGDPEDYTTYNRLRLPFAYTDAYNPIGLLGGRDDEADDEGDVPRDAYWQAFDTAGVFYICHHGCSSRSLLVITGPCRGEVWSDETANDAGYYPAMSSSGKRHTFASWYVEWLDRSRAQLDV